MQASSSLDALVLPGLYCTLLCTLLSAMRRGSGGEGPAAVTVRQRGPVLCRVEGLAGPMCSMRLSGRRVGCWDSSFSSSPPHRLFHFLSRTAALNRYFPCM